MFMSMRFFKWLIIGVVVQAMGWLVAVSHAADMPAIPATGKLASPVSAAAPGAESLILKGSASYKGKPVRDAIVYIDQIKGAVAAGGKVVELNQKGLKFLPRVMAVPAGTRLSFNNSDSVLHNIHAYDEKNRTLFNIAVIPDPQAKPGSTLSKAGVVLLKCDVHPEMSAYVLVLQNSYYTKTNARGEFEIRGIALPDGSYVVKFWHEDYDAADQTVRVQTASKESADVAFTQLKKL